MIVWHHATLDPPGEEHANKPVLVCREIGKGKGKYRKLDFGIFTPAGQDTITGRWEGKWNKSGVILWKALPEIPQD